MGVPLFFNWKGRTQMKTLWKTLLVLLCAAGLSAWADDVEDLTAADDEFLAKFNADENWGESLFSGEVVGFHQDDPVIRIFSGEEFRTGFDAWIESDERKDDPSTVTIRIRNRDVRVYGDTGVIASIVRWQVCSNAPTTCTRKTVRVLNTWSKLDGEWKLVAGHNS